MSTKPLSKEFKVLFGLTGEYAEQFDLDKYKAIYIKLLWGTENAVEIGFTDMDIYNDFPLEIDYKNIKIKIIKEFIRVSDNKNL